MIFSPDSPASAVWQNVWCCRNRGSASLLGAQYQVEFIARVLSSHSGRPGAMRLHSIALIRAWAEAADFIVERVTMEQRGIFGVLVARKV